jgi:hypothetical protein
MTPISYRTVSRDTSIRCRFKSLSAREVSQLETVKSQAFCFLTAYRREHDPIRKAMFKRRCGALVALSLSIREDVHEKLERPIRHCMVLVDITPEFSFEFLRFRRQHIDQLYALLRFPDEVILDNASVMCGEEVFLRGLYELVTGEKKTSIALRFGRHPSDQGRPGLFCIFTQFVFIFFLNNLFYSDFDGP